MESAAIQDLLNSNVCRMRKADVRKMFSQSVVVRCWPHIRQAELGALVTALVAQDSLTDPMVHRGKKLSGTWRNVRVWADWDQAEPDQDGERTLNLYQALYQGDATTIDYVITEGDCRYNVYTKWVIGSATQPALPTTPWAAGTTYRFGPLSYDQETSTWTAQIEKRVVQYRNITGLTRKVDASGTVTRQVQLGLTTETPAAMTPESGKVKTQDVAIRDDCSKDVTTDTDTPADQTAVSEEHSAARDVVETLHTEGAAIADKSASSGTIRKVDQKPTQAGNVRTLDTVVTPKDQTIVENEVSAAAVAVKTTHTEAAAALGAPTPETGKIKKNTDAATEAGKVRTTAEVITPADQTATDYEKSARETVIRVKHTEGSAISEPSAPAVGTRVRVVQDKTQAGNARTVLETRVTNDLSLTAFASEKLPNRSTQETVIDGTATEPSIATETHASLSKRKREDGTWEGIKRVYTLPAGFDSPTSISTSEKSATIKQYQYLERQNKFLVITFTYYEKAFKSRGDAMDWIKAAGTETPARTAESHGIGTTDAGGGYFIAHYYHRTGTGLENGTT